MSCSPAALLNIKSPKQQFASCFCGNSTGKQHVFRANPAHSCTQRFSKSCVLGLHVRLGCARSNTPKLECCHSFFFFFSLLCNSALINSNLQCSVCCMCTESFTFAHIHMSEGESHSVVSSSLWPHGLYSPWKTPDQSTGVGSLPLLQGIFPTQGSNPGLLHCRRILYQLSHQGSPIDLQILIS